MTKLCARGKAAAKRKFKVYPSAYANAYASKICAGKIKDPSGTKRKDWGPKKASEGAIMDMKKFKKNFALLSTGTWMIIYNENGKLNQEKIKKDTHLSHSIDNKVIAVARYPGGHEFKLLNKKVKEHSSININLTYLGI